MQCLFPFVISLKKDGKSIGVPCGKCAVCITNRVTMWSFRLEQEAKTMNSQMWFITLTYDNDNVPITEKGLMSLNKLDCQKFFKRLRKNIGGKTIKYYLAGEYGAKTKRPHYHIILLGLPDNFDITSMENIWSKGRVDMQIGGSGSIGYTCGYIAKGKIIPAFEGDDRQKEFALMSKGIGKGYLTPSILKWHEADIKRNYAVKKGGYKIPLPRYYRDKIYTEYEREQQAQLSVYQSRFDDQQRQYKEKYGSVENFWKDRYESYNQFNKNFFARKKQKSEL